MILLNIDITNLTLNWPTAIVLCVLILGGAYVLGKIFTD